MPTLPKKFKSWETYIKHSKLHEGILHACDQCNKEYASKNSLSAHKSHKHKFFFNCNKAFVRSAHLTSFWRKFL